MEKGQYLYNGHVEDDCAADGYASSMYTISVGAIQENGRPADFDEPCSAKMVVTYVTITGERGVIVR